MQDHSKDTVATPPADATGQTQEVSTPRPSRPGHDDPEQIGPYRILEKIGEGGMGVVYKAEQRDSMRRLVALKVIKLGMDTREVVARFEAERQALALMSHPNVAKVFEAGATDHGRPYFAMEFVPGIPLTDYCDQNNLTTRQRLDLFIPVCHAIQHAHQKGIIHRDLKPSNILVSMFDGQPVPKVIDFGIAKAANQALTEKTLYTQTGSLVGTPEYMSPEQAQTSGLDVDTRTDVYSLGVILYELLTGQLPLDTQALRKAGPQGMAQIIRETEPQKPSTRLSMIVEPSAGSPETPSALAARKRKSDPKTLARELRGDLDWITLKAMEKDRTRRYESAGALAADIRRYLDDEPITARPPSARYRFGKFVRKHRIGVSAAVLVVLALLLGVVGTTFEMFRARAATIRATKAEHDAIDQRNIAMENEAQADHTMARMLQVKGDFAAADPLLRHSLEIYRKLRGPEHADVASVLGELGNLQQASGNFKAAEKTYNDSLHMYQRLEAAHEVPPESVARAHEHLGSLFISANRLDDAEPELRKSLELYRATPNPDPMGLGSTLGDLGMLLARKNDNGPAEAMLIESLDNWKKVPHYESWVAFDIAAIAQTLERFHESRGDKAGALPYARQYYLIQIAHISMGIAANPNDTSFLRGRAIMYGHVGQFDKMADDLDRLIQFTPGDHMLYMEAACTRLYLGQTEKYRDLCKRMLQRFAAFPDARIHDRVAKTCLTGPHSIDDIRPVIGIARANIDPAYLKTVPGRGDVEALFRLCAAMAEYRGENYQQCLDLLNEDTQRKIGIEPRATALLFRAMAYRKLKQETEANTELGRALPLFNRMPSPAADVIDPTDTMQDWLIAQAVRREAESLLAGS
jgi:serine/threonine protein kinase